jgi:hypothetical protein
MLFFAHDVMATVAQALAKLPWQPDLIGIFAGYDSPHPQHFALLPDLGLRWRQLRNEVSHPIQDDQLDRLRHRVCRDRDWFLAPLQRAPKDRPADDLGHSLTWQQALLLVARLGLQPGQQHRSKLGMHRLLDQRSDLGQGV